MSSIMSFDNVKWQIGFCGIWCGSCMGGNGAVMELTRRYESIIMKSREALEKWAPKDLDFEGFVKSLASIQKMSSCPGCRKGGGSPTCKIRICALGKGFTDCSQCSNIPACGNFENLQRSNPHIKEQLLKLKNGNSGAVIEHWILELKSKWPHCVRLCRSTDS